MKPAGPAVYAADGWRFYRLPHGAVWVEHDTQGGGYEIDAATWADIVSTMSIGGKASYQAALDLHQGPPVIEEK